ncbi:MAG TPA: hypothetical protein VFV34_11525 [Blastocatellia bacterium]|nr:hypothetical protein [Blastocatellia bacterium]
MTKPYIGLLCSTMGVMLIVSIMAAPALPSQGLALWSLRHAHQSDEKVIERASYADEPVEIDNLAVKNIKIAFHQKFGAKSVVEQSGRQMDDWLEDFEFTVRNKSDKRISYLSISLRFPRLENPDPSVGTFYHFVLGVDPRATGQAATYADPFSLDAGASHTVRLSNKGLKEIEKRLAWGKTSLAEVPTVFLQVAIVGYEDGMQWQQGKLLRPAAAEKLQQSDKKAVERAWYDNEPYEIGELSVKNVNIASRQIMVPNGFTKARRDSYEFSSESLAKEGGGEAGDWLENLRFAIKNNADRQITYVGLSIEFPETEFNGPLMFYSLRLGLPPKGPAARPPQGETLALAPGDTTIFALSTEQLRKIKGFLALRKFQLAELNRAVIRIETMILDTGIMWQSGHYFKPSSTAPGGYARIDQ